MSRSSSTVRSTRRCELLSNPTPRHRLEFAVFGLVSAVIGVLPERAAMWMAGLLGSLAGGVLRVRRVDVGKHIELAFPDSSPEWRREVARASYTHVAREAVATFRVSVLGPEEVRRRTTMHGFEDLESEMDRGLGAIVLTGHLGNWEIGGAALAARGIPTDAVVFPQTNPLFDRHLKHTRARLGMTVIAKADARRMVLESLRKGRVAGLLADQNTRTRPVFVDFFGVPAATAKGPAVFALRTGAPVFMLVALREPGWPAHYRVLIERVPVERSGDLKADILSLTQAHVALLEAHVRTAPEQYFWQHRRWKTRPPEGLAPFGQKPLS